jgi:hypothetical protein
MTIKTITLTDESGTDHVLADAADIKSYIDSLSLGEITVLTSEPTADNPDWTADSTKYKFVLLSAAPTTKYAGYIYLTQA